MVRSSLAFALASPVLTSFRVSVVPQRGHLFVLGMFFSVILCCFQVFKLWFAVGSVAVLL
jgi:hypothetical protein